MGRILRPRFLAIAVHEQILTKEQARRIRNTQRSRATSGPVVRLTGEVAVELGLMAQAQVNGVLDLQREPALASVDYEDPV